MKKSDAIEGLRLVRCVESKLKDAGFDLTHLRPIESAGSVMNELENWGMYVIYEYPQAMFPDMCVVADDSGPLVVVHPDDQSEGNRVVCTSINQAITLITMLRPNEDN